MAPPERSTTDKSGPSVGSAAMNPREQECIGLYMFGAGYFARDENTLSLLTDGKVPPNFCLGCRVREECENRHERRVRRLLPTKAEKFDRAMRVAVKKGIGPTLAAVMLAKKGLDPFAELAIDNFARGHAERGRTAGPLVG